MYFCNILCLITNASRFFCYLLLLYTMREQAHTVDQAGAMQLVSIFRELCDHIQPTCTTKLHILITACYCNGQTTYKSMTNSLTQAQNSLFPFKIYYSIHSRR